MFPEERKQKIYDLVNEKRSVKVAELSKRMKISEVTVRRDLDELAKRNRIVRTHGGAIAIYSVGSEISAAELIVSNKNIKEKQKIANLAYTFVNDKDTIFADGSSSVYELIKLIANGDKRDLLIITTSMLVVDLLGNSKNAKVIIISGEVNFKHKISEGYLTIEGIRNLRADKCFIGINGIDSEFGLSTPRFIEAEQKTEMIRSSIQSFILADSTKFGKVYLAKIKEGGDYILTDTCKSGDDYEWICETRTLLFADRELK